MAAEPLAGRRALITGASRGIGAACARQLAAAGATCILVSRDKNTLAPFATQLTPQAQVHIADLSDPDSLVPWLREMGSSDVPDIVVNNAGAFTIAPLEETPVDDLKQALRLNLASPFLIVRALLGAMKKRGHGHIVTIGSIADHVAFPGNALYAATKFGIRGMHEVLREETRGTGVRATLISPGPTDTNIWDTVDPDNKPGYTPRAKMLAANDVAQAVLWAVTQPAGVNVDEMRLSHS
jgi:3-hydroxy acid dehydrogenase / malonic semialdehyde reductase